MKRLTSILLLSLALGTIHCSAMTQGVDFIKEQLLGDKPRDVDYSAAILLLPEYVETVPNSNDDSGTAPGGNTPQAPIPGISEPIHNLFTLPPGTQVAVSRMSGSIDPVGTTLTQDYDGDGILNSRESVSNIWVSDYPVIESSIATPITMKIEILRDVQGETNEILSEITANDVEDTKNDGMENIHRNEVNDRTVQYQESYSQYDSQGSDLSFGHSNSSSASGSVTDPGIIAGVPLTVGGGGSSSSSGNSLFSWSNSNSEGGTSTHWKDVEFKNHLNSDTFTTLSDFSTRSARKYRNELRSKTDINTEIKADAGYVRAALYIKNMSVNMPVRLTNIYCSLVFETPSGEIAPVQTFRLRNDDYSLFNIDIYGNSEFGPYVIELPNLNTVEIENAIKQGYNPKIFIVGYDMTHVPNSNYKEALANYSGDNLKIVEENAKGRTALIKLLGPGLREMFRMTAFDTDVDDEDCQGTGVTKVSPGVSLRKALKRLKCNGVDVEFENYVIDLSSDFPGLKQSRIFVPGIKRIGPIKNEFPCTQQTFNLSGGETISACVQKPIEEWTEIEKNNLGMWAVYADGKYYSHSEYIMENGQIKTLNGLPADNGGISMLKGIDSMLWAGDHFDIAYVSSASIKKGLKQFGNTPLDREDDIKVSTLWDLNTAGDSPFLPNVHSKYLGQVGLGDKIELTFKLKGTQIMAYDFGANVSSSADLEFDNFNYEYQTYVPGINDDLLFNLEQVVDFEINLGVGGAYSDWFNLLKDSNTDQSVYDAKKPSLCGKSTLYLEQVFTLCIQMPTEHDYIMADGVVSLYIRPVMNSVYRNTVWPTPANKVEKLRARLKTAADKTDTLRIHQATGTIEANDFIYLEGDSGSYQVASVTPETDGYLVTLTNTLTGSIAPDTRVYVSGNLTQSQVKVLIQENFFQSWNLDVDTAANLSNLWFQPEPVQLLEQELNLSNSDCNTNFHPMKCLGADIPYINGNWAGNHNFGNPNWNSFFDASQYPDMFATFTNPALQSGAGQEIQFFFNGSNTADIDTIQHGVNNFFTAPLIERIFEITAKRKQ